MTRSNLRLRRTGALFAALGVGLVVVAAPTAAFAKISPPEWQSTPRGQWWTSLDGPVHQTDDPCSDNGPSGDASVGCDDPGGPEDPGSGSPWGGPGERIAVGRDSDIEDAVDEAEAEADSVCHDNWQLVDFDVDIAVGSPVVYTLTYECS